MTTGPATQTTIRNGIRAAIARQTTDADRVARVLHAVFVVGGALAVAVAQVLTEDNRKYVGFLVDWQLGITWLGAVVAAFGGWLTFWLQRRNPQELQLASEALSLADAERLALVEERLALGREYRLVSERDERRRQIAAALLAILEAVDRILVERPRRNIRRDIEGILEAGADSILDGLNIRSDRYCFSVFQRQGEAGAEAMTLLAERRARSLKASGGTHRRWAKGKGYTGFAWGLGYEVVIPDTTLAHWRQNCRAEEGTTEEDRNVYRSVMSVPIRPGPDRGEPWGMITVTSDRAGRFGDPEQGADINADAVRAIAKALAILVAARYL